MSGPGTPAPDRLVLVGAGSVARALATNALGHGLAVEHWVRRPDAAQVPEGAGVTALGEAGVQQVTAVLAVPFPAVEDVVPRLPLAPGSVLVDATNPFGRPLPAGATAGAAVVAGCAPQGVRVVKAFNVLGAEHMAQPRTPTGSPVLPVAGDDPDARAHVAALAARLDFDAVEVGDLGSAALMEEAARYWGLLAMAGGLGRGVVLLADRRGGPGA